jgi:hypothetical protein
VHTIAYAFPNVKIVTSAVDPEINEKFHVLPGMGNFGDRWDILGTSGEHFGMDGGTWRQCCGFICFWAIRIQKEVRIRLRILLSSSKSSKTKLDSYCLVTSF